MCVCLAPSVLHGRTRPLAPLLASMSHNGVTLMSSPHTPPFFPIN